MSVSDVESGVIVASDMRLTCWTQRTEPEWLDFLREWWGNTEAFMAREAPYIIVVRQRKVWEQLLPLSDFPSKGIVHVRAEYLGYYDRMERGGSSRARRGVVITSSCGIGKSYFAFYALLRRLALKKLTAFATTCGSTYWFDGHGVYCEPTSVINAYMTFPNICPKPGDRRIWYLADTPADLATPVDGRPYRSRSTIFFALFSPPDPSCYRTQTKSGGVAVWIMNPWSRAELEMITQQPMTRMDSDASLEITTSPVADVKRLFPLLGGLLRDIQVYAADPETIGHRVEQAISEICDIALLNQLFWDPMVFTTSQHASRHAMLLLRRNQSLEPLQDDELMICPRGEIIFEPLLQRLARLQENYRRTLASTYARVSAEFSPLWSYVFKVFAVHDLSQQITSVLHRLARMTPHRNHSTTGISFTYDPSHRIIDASPQNSAPGAAILALPLVPRTPLAYDPKNLRVITVDPSNFYYSTALHNPPLDAFFFQCYPDDAAPNTWQTVELYVLQMLPMTLGDSRGMRSDTRGLNEAVATICKKVRRKIPKAAIKVYYVLVVPCMAHGYYKLHEVRWNMDLALDDEAGEVYVQCLDYILRW